MFSFVSLLFLKVGYTEPWGVEQTVFFVFVFLRKEGRVSGEARLGEVYPF